jgi:hypothetical protein
MFQDPCGKNRFQKSQNNIGLFTDLQVVFRMLKPAKIKHYILKAAARGAKGFAFCLASLSASGDVLRTVGLPAAF